jgi:hypothetical protein
MELLAGVKLLLMANRKISQQAFNYMIAGHAMVFHFRRTSSTGGHFHNTLIIRKHHKPPRYA